MAAYRFSTVWSFDAPIEAVWDALMNLDTQRWWPGTAVTRLAPGDRHGVGAVLQYHMRTKLPYTLSFVAVITALEEPRLLELQAEGELVGTGRWQLVQEGPRTRATYTWNVETTQHWMNLLAPLLRPAFAWNHRQVMSAGARGLAAHLGVPLVAAVSSAS